MIYSSHNDFRIKSEIKLSEYNCNQDLVFSKTENQIGFSIVADVMATKPMGNDKKSVLVDAKCSKCHTIKRFFFTLGQNKSGGVSLII